MPHPESWRHRPACVLCVKFLFKRLWNVFSTLEMMQHTGCLGLVHWDDPEGWSRAGGAGMEEGEGCRLGNMCTPVADSC